jgi:hypothetical protein
MGVSLALAEYVDFWSYRWAAACAPERSVPSATCPRTAGFGLLDGENNLT